MVQPPYDEEFKVFINETQDVDFETIEETETGGTYNAFFIGGNKNDTKFSVHYSYCVFTISEDGYSISYNYKTVGQATFDIPTV